MVALARRQAADSEIGIGDEARGKGESGGRIPAGAASTWRGAGRGYEADGAHEADRCTVAGGGPAQVSSATDSGHGSSRAGIASRSPWEHLPR